MKVKKLLKLPLQRIGIARDSRVWAAVRAARGGRRPLFYEESDEEMKEAGDEEDNCEDYNNE